MHVADHSKYILLILLIFLKAPFSWGFSVSRIEKYKKVAIEKQLYENKKWLKLGHYEKNYSGFHSDFSGYFFISEDGAASPKNELLSNIDAFFSESKDLTEKYKRHPQCQFLARRRWLIKELNIDKADILPCSERIEWKKHLNASSVSMVFAAADLGNPASSFGHTFIKLINPENSANKDLIDYGVNYAAAAEVDTPFYAFKGLFGFFPGTYTMEPYHQKIREYINLEGRDIYEYRLAFSPDEVDELIDHLLEFEGTTAPYYFLSTNCSYQIIYLFEVIRPDLQLTDNFNAWVIPIDTVKILSQKSNLIVEKKRKQSLNSDYLDNYKKLNLLQRKALDDAIEKLKIPDDYELSSVEKADVYETGMKYFAVEAYRTETDLDEKKYKLSIERSVLGQIKTFEKPKANLWPEESHDSSALYYGAGKNPASNYMLLKFRIAFHDLEQVNIGLPKVSLSNAGVFELRHYSENQKLVFERFTFLHLLNTPPISPLDKHWSWKARIDIRENFQPDLEGGGGFSYDLNLFDETRLSFMMIANYMRQLEKDNLLGGPEILFFTRPHDKIGFSVFLAHLAENKKLAYTRLKVSLNYELWKNADIQLKANDQQDYQLSFVRSFIF